MDGIEENANMNPRDSKHADRPPHCHCAAGRDTHASKRPETPHGLAMGILPRRWQSAVALARGRLSRRQRCRQSRLEIRPHILREQLPSPGQLSVPVLQQYSDPTGPRSRVPPVPRREQWQETAEGLVADELRAAVFLLPVSPLEIRRPADDSVHAPALARVAEHLRRADLGVEYRTGKGTIARH